MKAKQKREKNWESWTREKNRRRLNTRNKSNARKQIYRTVRDKSTRCIENDIFKKANRSVLGRVFYTRT